MAKPAKATQGKRKSFISPSVVPMYIWTALFTALPLVYVIAISFLKKDEIWGVTNEFTLQNYINLFNPDRKSVV